MAHLTDEHFALLTLEGREALPFEAAGHVAACDRCRYEVESYTILGAALREPIELKSPPEDVWARIAAELEAEQAEQAGQVERAGQAERAEQAGPASLGGSPIEPEAPSSLAPVVPLRPRATVESRWMQRLAFAAAASFALGAASTAVLNQLISRPSTDILQSIGLEPLPGWSDEGTATLEVVDGERVLVIDLPETDIDGFREVWLIDRNVERLVSLGTMNGDHAAFPIPEGLDLEDYVVVDVSQEHFDGDPTHSGESIVRGVLS